MLIEFYLNMICKSIIGRKQFIDCDMNREFLCIL